MSKDFITTYNEIPKLEERINNSINQFIGFTMQAQKYAEDNSMKEIDPLYLENESGERLFITFNW